MIHGQTSQLSPVRVLQQSDRNSTTLLESPSGELVVEKKFLQKPQSLNIEISYLRKNGGQQFHYLEIPRLLEIKPDSILISFVERDEYTRDTILERKWSPTDVDSFCRGVEEFQKTRILSRWFNPWRQCLGRYFVQIKAVQLFRKACRGLGLVLREKKEFLSLLFQYSIDTSTVQFVTTHYDLNTLNYTFTPSGKMSILDFELAYYLGDPLYDVMYYMTIPTVRISDWTFQKQVLNRFLEIEGKTPNNLRRARFLLLICSIMRFFHFKDRDWQREEYRENIRLLLDKKAFRRELVSGDRN